MTVEELGIAFAQLDSVSQAEFFQAVVDESKTWDITGYNQWIFIGEQLRKDEFREARDMIEVITSSMNRRPAAILSAPLPLSTPESDLGF